MVAIVLIFINLFKYLTTELGNCNVFKKVTKAISEYIFTEQG